MRKIYYGVAVLWMLLLGSVTSLSAQVSIGIQTPNVSIGINLPVYPRLAPVPGYPVYYAPQVNANYFFYDGMYWVFLGDYWYASYWYNGPWTLVEPTYVPVYILRIPVRYYRHPPAYFHGWRADAPPRWGQHWGHDWEKQRKGWDKWKRSSVPPRAPLPTYQRQYTGERYPHAIGQQQELRRQHYRYQPRDKAVRQHFRQQGEQRAPAPARRERQEEPRMKTPGQDTQRQMPQPHGQEQRYQERERPQGGPAGPRSQPQFQPPPQQGPAYPEQRQQPKGIQHERQTQQPHGQEQRYQQRDRPQESRGQGHGKEERDR